MGRFRVGFLIAGAQKGGTTSLDAYLRQHPEVGMARTKEVHFFDAGRRLKGWGKYRKYHRQFTPRPKTKIYGEGTPIYLYWAEAMRRVWEYNPGMKLIALLRNPVERAYSHWRMERRRGIERLSFAQAIRQEPERAREALPVQHRIYSYVDRGFYSEQIRRVRRYFPRQQLLFLKSEDFFRDPAKAMKTVTDFLEVERHRFQTETIHNIGTIADPMGKKDKDFLIDVYRKDIEEVERLLGWDCRDWLK
jgi:hypothetical protein